MTRLRSELRRLYLTCATDTDALGAETLCDTEGRSRALVLTLAQAVGWQAVLEVWRGVQADSGLPAPAIAVSGDGFQLWFSLSAPVTPARGQRFLTRIRDRYLSDIPHARIGLLPVAGGTGEAGDPGPDKASRHADLVPAELQASGRWSAFVAPDLVAVFADTPWLDLPPSRDGQADLLSRLQAIRSDAFEAMLVGDTADNGDARRAGERQDERIGGRSTAPRSPASGARDQLSASGQRNGATRLGPRRFLMRVINDDDAPLALRIEAAKALLPYTLRDEGGANSSADASV